jgi:hypothetical protein
MTTEVAVTGRSLAPRFGRVRSFVFGPPLPARLPERVQATIREDQDQWAVKLLLDSHTLLWW